MPQWLLALRPFLLTFGSAVGTILLSLLSGLFSEVFLKRALFLLLGKWFRKTKNKTDDELLAEAKKASHMEDIP